MKLPNAELAVVDVAKFRDYCLNPFHEEGKHKARVFSAALGLTALDANWLRAQLLVAAHSQECQLGEKTAHGQRYVLDFGVSVRGRSARLRGVWIVRPGEVFARLVTCYVL